MKKEMNNKGFSLVELIIVIAIMAVLMGVLAPQYLKYVRSSKVSTDITNAENIATAVSTAVADGDLSIIKITSGTATAGGGTVELIREPGTGGNPDRVVYLPDSKVSPGTSWKLTYDAVNGMTKIELGGTEIWPNSNNYN